MSSISSTSYVLPSRRSWDPLRVSVAPSQDVSTADDYWEDGKEVKGHPNICTLLDFFEDANYYYLVMPSSTREPTPEDPSPPSDLFDLVERYPNGLPPSDIRTYLGQIADALSFLHMKGIGKHTNLK
jgi:protein-serine/threonine kinase